LTEVDNLKQVVADGTARLTVAEVALYIDLLAQLEASVNVFGQ
jgi:hypothetical protein